MRVERDGSVGGSNAEGERGEGRGQDQAAGLHDAASDRRLGEGMAAALEPRRGYPLRIAGGRGAWNGQRT